MVKPKPIFSILPSQSSELHKIEVLWHPLKHLWLRLEDSTNQETLKDAVDDSLAQIHDYFCLSA
jgi:hypothetical protein